ncbi:kunitz/Bovine pancreatic trypsin inhibitor domain-containing protein [Ditylenchus destructor]|nr:kunitz/Bovine pancreatic trypsin inhibitor domain-containing protein [Ditylenchus destructor]
MFCNQNLKLVLYYCIILAVYFTETKAGDEPDCAASRDPGTDCVCQPFNFKGCGGNSNRFESSEECKKTCANSKKASQWVHAEKCNGTHLIPDGKYIECSSNPSECPEDHHCNTDNGVCCPTKNHVCSLRDDTGTFAEGIDDKPRHRSMENNQNKRKKGFNRMRRKTKKSRKSEESVNSSLDGTPRVWQEVVKSLFHEKFKPVDSAVSQAMNNQEWHHHETPNITQISEQTTQAEERPTETSMKIFQNPNNIIPVFLDWLRLPENEELYNELLTLNPVMLDCLIRSFGSQLQAHKMSQAEFECILDKLHITYDVQNPVDYAIPQTMNNLEHDLHETPEIQNHKRKRQPKEKQMDTPMEETRTLAYTVITMDSTTPMPNYDAMDLKELNKELDRNGRRPMCRSKAILALREIFEVTHPVLSSTTPIHTAVTRILMGGARKAESEAAALAREKRIRAAIATVAPSDPTASQTMNDLKALTQAALLATDKNPNNIIPVFLDWLRLPENEELYNELLTLNPVMQDHLTRSFGPQLQAHKISQPNFTSILDKLHITYCVRPPGDGRHY